MQPPEPLEVEQHDAGADLVRVVPVDRALVGVGRHGDGGGGPELVELLPQERGVADEERVGVDEDGALDGVWEDLVDEQFHEPGC